MEETQTMTTLFRQQMASFFCVEEEEAESGQLLILLAFSMVGLLLAAGLALDSGILFMRQAMLDRATDAAVLVGIIDLYHADSDVLDDRLNAANQRGVQTMALNGVVLGGPAEGLEDIANPGCYIDPEDPDSGYADPVAMPGNPLFEVVEYCGDQRVGQFPGAIRYYIETQWNSPTFFMRLAGFDTIRLRSAAEAEYYPFVEILASSLGQQGVLKSSIQAVFGPGQQRSFGDAFSPVSMNGVDDINNLDNEALAPDNPEWFERRGSIDYRINVPPDYSPNELRVELFDPDSLSRPGNATDDVWRRGDLTRTAYFVPQTWVDPGGLSYTGPWPPRWDDLNNADKDAVAVANGFPGGRSDVEADLDANLDLLIDPNPPTKTNDNQACTASANDTCIRAIPGLETEEALRNDNPFWFYRTDEYRQRGGGGSAVFNRTPILFRLSYFR
ncbi:MAG: hypothetical protein GYB68_00580 [Chloroflexi bacterium]|nr:hypothetical protein [Chloroflexota bacterium]